MAKITIRPVEKNGRRQYCVDVPRSLRGSRQRTYYTKKEEALAYRQSVEQEMREHGGSLGSLATADRLALQRWREHFSLAELEDLVAGALRERQANNLRQLTVAMAVEDYIRARQGTGAGDLHLSDLRSRLGRFARNDTPDFGARLVRGVKAGEIDLWLSRLELAPVTRKNYRKVLAAFFGYAELHEWIEVDPMRRVPRTEAGRKREAEVLSAAELSTGLKVVAPQARLRLVLGAFAGLRRSEVLRLERADIDGTPGYIFVRKLKTQHKGMRERYVKILPNLRAWLDWLPLPASGRVVPNADRLFREQRRAMLVALRWSSWPDNCLRRSFCSHHLALYQNSALTAEQAGHTSATMTYASYRRPLTREEGEAYLSVTPVSLGLVQTSPPLGDPPSV